MNGAPFPIRFDPDPRESYLGYCLRLAAANRYSYPLVHGPVAALLSSGRRAAAVDHIVARTGSDPVAVETLLADAPTSRRDRYVPGRVVDRRHFDGVPKVCPICILERAFLPALWDLRLHTACARHGIRLVARCPTCGRDLSWNRREVDGCGTVSCPGRPSEASTVAATEGETRLAAMFDRACSGPADAGASEFVHGLELGDLVCLADALSVPVRFYRDDLSTKRRFSPEQAAEHAGVLLSGWPDAVRSYLRAISDDERATRDMNVNARFGRLVGMVSREDEKRRKLTDRARQLLIDEIRVVGGDAVTLSNAPVALRRRDVEDRSLVTFAEAGAMLGIAPATVKAVLRRTGIVSQTLRRSRNIVHLVRRQDLESLRVALAYGTDRRTFKTSAGMENVSVVAQVLGSGVDTVRFLAAAGLISTTAYQEHVLHSASDATSLVGRLRDRCVEGDGPVSSFRNAARQLPWFTVGEVAVMALEGGIEIRRSWPERTGLRQFGIPMTCLRELDETIRSWLTAHEAGRVIGCRGFVVRELIEAGLLIGRSESVGASGRRTTTVEKQALREFDERYVLSSRIVAEDGIHVRRLAKMLREAGVPPASRLSDLLWVVERSALGAAGVLLRHADAPVLQGGLPDAK